VRLYLKDCQDNFRLYTTPASSSERLRVAFGDYHFRVSIIEPPAFVDHNRPPYTAVVYVPSTPPGDLWEA